MTDDHDWKVARLDPSRQNDPMSVGILGCYGEHRGDPLQGGSVCLST